jgi:hypothetical protein
MTFLRLATKEGRKKKNMERGNCKKKLKTETKHERYKPMNQQSNFTLMNIISV